MNNDVVNRLTAIMERYNLNQSEFARRIGVKQPNLSAILKGERKCGDGVANKIALSFDINPMWLLTGEGEMLRKTPHNEVEDLTPAEQERIDAAMTDGRVTYVPLIPASAFAGGIKGFAPESVSLRNCELVVSHVVGADYAIPITGDSMEPAYADGSIAYIKRINEAAFLPWGNVVILDTENGAFIKAIYPDEDNDDFIWAKSFNPNYPPLHIPKSSVFRIFRVLGTSRIFTTM